MRAERLLKLKEEHNLEGTVLYVVCAKHVHLVKKSSLTWCGQGVDDDDISVEDFFVWKEKHLDEDDAFLSDWRDGRGVSIGRLLYEEGELAVCMRPMGGVAEGDWPTSLLCHNPVDCTMTLRPSLSSVTRGGGAMAAAHSTPLCHLTACGDVSD